MHCSLLFESSDPLVAAIVAVALSVIGDTLAGGKIFAEVFNDLIFGLALLSLALELSFQQS